MHIFRSTTRFAIIANKKINSNKCLGKRKRYQLGIIGDVCGIALLTQKAGERQHTHTHTHIFLISRRNDELYWGDKDQLKKGCCSRTMCTFAGCPPLPIKSNLAIIFFRWAISEQVRARTVNIWEYFSPLLEKHSNRWSDRRWTGPSLPLPLKGGPR